LRAESHQLKELLAELMMENRLLKKSVLGDGESDTWGYAAVEKIEIIRAGLGVSTPKPEGPVTR